MKSTHYGLKRVRNHLLIQSLHRHQELVARLKKPGGHILACVSPESLDLLHMAVGIAGETFELCEAEDSGKSEHTLEELGDLLFYIEGYRQCLQLKVAFNVPDSVVNATVDSLKSRQGLLAAAGHLLDLTKRYAIYDKKPFDVENAKAALLQVYIFVLARMRIQGHTLQACLEANCDKLSTRYSSGRYSDSQAQDRADKA